VEHVPDMIEHVATRMEHDPARMAHDRACMEHDGTWWNSVDHDWYMNSTCSNFCKNFWNFFIIIFLKSVLSFSWHLFACLCDVRVSTETGHRNKCNSLLISSTVIACASSSNTCTTCLEIGDFPQVNDLPFKKSMQTLRK